MNIYNKHLQKTQLIADLRNILGVWEEIFEDYLPKTQYKEKDYYTACIISLESDSISDKDFIHSLPFLIEINLEEEGYFKPLTIRMEKIDLRPFEMEQKRALIIVSDKLNMLDEIINNRNQDDLLTFL
ncbi:MAG: hypothetical protein NTW25_12320 [Candidatus Kapabacteria bacterium]|nr:hypothetical protein [Candidatus Kapabacteria bacterium]